MIRIVNSKASATLAACGVGMLSVALVACGSSGTAVVVPAEAGHVHGMVESPAGELLIGTHAGVFTPQPDGGLTRVGDGADYMGLAALSSGALLSSGHPAPDSSEPNPVGLRQSVDTGATWTTITQMPRDDYHVITAGAGKIYAAGSTGAMYAGSAPTAMAKVADAPSGLINLAVEPGRGFSLLAATQSGLQRSGNGGRTWTPAGDAVGLLSWAERDALFMVDSAGDVSMSGNGGSTWSRRGSLGAPPAAILATSASGLVAADHQGRILTSTDGGATFVESYTA